METPTPTTPAASSTLARLPAPAITAELLQRAVLADPSLLQAISGAAVEMPMGRTRRVLRRLSQQLSDDPKRLDWLPATLQELPMLARASLHTGLESGQVAARLSEVAACYRQQQSHIVRLVSAVAYPGLLLVLSMMLVAFVLSEALPALGSVSEQESPLERLSWWATMIRGGLRGVTILLGATLVLVLVVPLVSGRLGWSILWWTNPVCGTLIHWQFTLRYLQSLALLLRQELPVPEALEILSSDRPRSVTAMASRALESAVRRGVPLSDAMRQSGLYPASCLPFVEWGESHGKLVSGLEMAQQMLAARLRHSMEWLNTLIPMIVYLLVGAAVLLAVGAMLSAVGQSLRLLM